MKYIIVLLMLATSFASCSSSKSAKNKEQQTSKEAVSKFEASRLYATPWRIVKLETADKTIEVPSDIEATIVFNEKESRVNGRCCNSYFGSFSLNGNVVTFDKMGATKMMCHGVLNDMETMYFILLDSPQTIEINNQKMVFKSDKGTVTFTAFNLE